MKGFTVQKVDSSTLLTETSQNEDISMDNMTLSSSIQFEGETFQRQSIDFDGLKFRKDLPPLFKNVCNENLEELEKEIVQEPNSVNKERYLGDALIHTATKVKKLGSLQTLLRNGAKVSLLDVVGATPLHNAVSGKWQEGIIELLKYGASPDKFSQPKSSVKEVVPRTPLHLAVREGDIQSTVLLLRQSPDLRLSDGLQQTLLHMAAEANSMKLLTRLLQDTSCHEIISQKDWKGNSILHVAIQKNNVKEEDEDEVEYSILKMVELLIEHGIDVNSTNLEGVTPIYLAAQNRLPSVAKRLLKSGVDLSVVSGSNNSVLHAACESDCNECLNIFLESGKLVKDFNTFITMRNNKGKDPFHIAIDSGSTRCCESLLNNGDHLGYIDYDGKTRCSLILEKIPNALELLNQVFDNHISVSKKSQRDPNFYVEFDYSAIFRQPNEEIHSAIIRQQTEELQCSLIPKLTAPQFEQILKHPLIESFLFLKWYRLQSIFYIYVCLFLLFLIVHSYYIYCTFGHNGTDWNEHTTKLQAIRLIHIILYVSLLFPGIVMVLWNKSFFKDRETYYIIASFLASAFVVFSPHCFALNRTELIERPIAAVSAVLSWGEFMLLLGKFPKFGVYISMLSNISKSIFKVLLGFSSLLIGFALGFAILYNDQPVFATPVNSFVKVLMMMIGEYNYIDMPKSEDKAGESKVYILYFGSMLLIMFLFMVSILMTNLLIGIAVHDIGELKRHGRIRRLYQQAQYIISYENLIKYLNEHKWKRVNKILIKIGSIRTKTRIYPNKSLQTRVPKDTINQSIKIKTTGKGRENSFQYNDETDCTKMLKAFSAFKITNLHQQQKQRTSECKQNKLILDRLENLENLLQSHLPSFVENYKSQRRGTVY